MTKMKNNKKKPAPVAMSAVRRSTRASQRPAPAKRRASRPIGAVKAWRLANEFCLFHYPTLYTGGPPKRSSSAHSFTWIVPIVLASPVDGIMGEVGQLSIDAKTGKVIASTDRSEVVAAGARLFQRKNNARPSSLQARKS